VLLKHLPDNSLSAPWAESDKIALLDLSEKKLEECIKSLDSAPYRYNQIINWLYRKDVLDFAFMTDISKDTKNHFAQFCTPSSRLKRLEVVTDNDGTVKILWGLKDGLTVESVLIDEGERLTLCLSTQVGCRMGCRFCRTGSMGLIRNLSQGEIVCQIIESRRLLENPKKLTNLVLMGMGEPLDNPDNTFGSLSFITNPKFMAFNQRRVTLSTVGVIPQLEKLSQAFKSQSFSLTISLGSAVDSVRSQIMPSNRAWPVDDLKKLLERFPLRPGWRFTFSYVMLEGVNDSKKQALALVKFLAHIKSKVNLIPFNPWPGAPFTRPKAESVLSFQKVLTDSNISTFIRRTNGLDSNAACGLLVAKNQDRQNSSPTPPSQPFENPSDSPALPDSQGY
jgi:23S rRNA (adenine2503-C2)-methyltransferase